MRDKLNRNTKTFFANFFLVVLIMILAIIVMGFVGMAEAGGRYDLLSGYIVVSFFALIYAAYRVAMDFVQNNKK